MDVLELTISATRRRPAGQYAMDDTTATMRVAVPAGSDVAGLIVEARRVLDAGLNAGLPAPAKAGDARPAPAAPPGKPWRVTISGVGLRARSALRPLGFEWASTAYVGNFETELKARAAGDAAEKTVAGAKASEPTKEGA